MSDDRKIHVADCFPVRDTALVEHMLAQSEGHDTRSEWTWLRTADGDLIVGFFPSGETYESLENVVADDYDAAVKNGTHHDHTLPLGDFL